MSFNTVIRQLMNGLLLMPSRTRTPITGKTMMMILMVTGRMMTMAIMKTHFTGIVRTYILAHPYGTILQQKLMVLMSTLCATMIVSLLVVELKTEWTKVRM